MSRENVELVRLIYEAFNRRDIVTPFEIYAEDIVWDLSNMARADLFLQPIVHGHEGVREGWRDVLGAFASVDFAVEELTDAGDKVFAAIRETDVGRASGAAVSTPHYAVWTLDGGKVTRLQVFDVRALAEEAAGLEWARTTCRSRAKSAHATPSSSSAFTGWKAPNSGCFGSP